MPLMKKVTRIISGEKESKRLNTVSLSNSTVKRRIADISDDHLELILPHMKKSPFYSILSHESIEWNSVVSSNRISILFHSIR